MTDLFIPSHIQPKPFELGALAEGARADTFLAGRSAFMTAEPTEPDPSPSIDVRHDVEAGLQWVLDYIGPTTIVAIEPDGPTTARYFDETITPAVTRWAKARNGAGKNLYFHINEPKAGLAKKAAKADIIKIRAVAFLDIDAKDGRSLEQALAAIISSSLPPASAIIASGGGFQPLWLLDVPVPASPNVVARLEALGERLEPMTGSDAVRNIDRILRLPFTKNYPNAKKQAAGRGISVAGLVRNQNAG